MVKISWFREDAAITTKFIFLVIYENIEEHCLSYCSAVESQWNYLTLRTTSSGLVCKFQISPIRWKTDHATHQRPGQQCGSRVAIFFLSLKIIQMTWSHFPIKTHRYYRKGLQSDFYMWSCFSNTSLRCFKNFITSGFAVLVQVITNYINKLCILTRSSLA